MLDGKNIFMKNVNLSSERIIVGRNNFHYYISVVKDIVRFIYIRVIFNKSLNLSPLML